jgi:hypothetical protein
MARIESFPTAPESLTRTAGTVQALVEAINDEAQEVLGTLPDTSGLRPVRGCGTRGAGASHSRHAKVPGCGSHSRFSAVE